MQPLYVKHRPKSWDQVAGNRDLIARLQRLRGFGGRAFWLYGPSGSGKSTIAMLIAREIRELAEYALRQKGYEVPE